MSRFVPGSKDPRKQESGGNTTYGSGTPPQKKNTGEIRPEVPPVVAPAGQNPGPPNERLKDV